MINGVHTLNVLVEVAEERHRQDERWGLQDFPFHHPDDGDGETLIGTPYAFWAQSFKDACDSRRDHAVRGGMDRRSGLLVLLEEVAEAAAEMSPEKIREELVQVAAVAVKLIEALDRAESKKHGPGCELGMWHGGDCGPSYLTRAVKSAMTASTVPETFRPEGFSQITRETVQHTIKTLMEPDELAAVQDYFGPGVTTEQGPESVTFSVPLADAVAPDADLTDVQKRFLAGLPDATLELKLDPLPTHVLDPYDAVGGDMDALLAARTALGRAPVCGREAATAAPCSDHWPVPAVVSLRHAYNGAGRLHGICRCAEGRDHWSHQCPDCEHGFHTAPCRELVSSGAPGDVDECGCQS